MYDSLLAKSRRSYANATCPGSGDTPPEGGSANLRRSHTHPNKRNGAGPPVSSSQRRPLSTGSSVFESDSGMSSSGSASASSSSLVRKSSFRTSLDSLQEDSGCASGSEPICHTIITTDVHPSSLLPNSSFLATLTPPPPPPLSSSSTDDGGGTTPGSEDSTTSGGESQDALGSSVTTLVPNRSFLAISEDLLKKPSFLASIESLRDTDDDLDDDDCDDEDRDGDDDDEEEDDEIQEESRRKRTTASCAANSTNRFSITSSLSEESADVAHSRLSRRSSSVDTTSSSLIRQYSNELSYTDRVIAEIVDTERDYVSDLSNIVRGYIIPLRDNKDLDLDEGTLNNLFNNVEAVCACNAAFLAQLESTDRQLDKVAECFVSHRDAFDVYTEYCTNYPTSVSVLTKLVNDPKVADIFKKYQMSLQQSLSLGAYLLKPVQRILKYHLLLQNIVKHLKSEEENSAGGKCSPTSERRSITASVTENTTTSTRIIPSSPVTTINSRTTPLLARSVSQTSSATALSAAEKALEVMTAMASHINDMKRKHEHAVRVQEIQSLLLGWDGADLTTYGELVAEGSFRLMGAKTLRHLLLFDKMLMMCKKKDGGHLQYKQHILADEEQFLSEISLRETECSSLMLIESIQDEPLCFQALSFDNPTLQYTFKCRSGEQKREWCLQLKRAIIDSYDNAIPSHAKQLVLELGQSRDESPVRGSAKKTLSAPQYLKRRKYQERRRSETSLQRAFRLKKGPTKKVPSRNDPMERRASVCVLSTEPESSQNVGGKMRRNSTDCISTPLGENNTLHLSSVTSPLSVNNRPLCTSTTLRKRPTWRSWITLPEDTTDDDEANKSVVTRVRKVSLQHPVRVVEEEDDTYVTLEFVRKPHSEPNTPEHLNKSIPSSKSQEFNNGSASGMVTNGLTTSKSQDFHDGIPIAERSHSPCPDGNPFRRAQSLSEMARSSFRSMMTRRKKDDDTDEHESSPQPQVISRLQHEVKSGSLPRDFPSSMNQEITSLDPRPHTLATETISDRYAEFKRKPDIIVEEVHPDHRIYRNQGFLKCMLQSVGSRLRSSLAISHSDAEDVKSKIDFEDEVATTPTPSRPSSRAENLPADLSVSTNSSSRLVSHLSKAYTAVLKARLRKEENIRRYLAINANVGARMANHSDASEIICRTAATAVSSDATEVVASEALIDSSSLETRPRSSSSDCFYERNFEAIELNGLIDDEQAFRDSAIFSDPEDCAASIEDNVSVNTDYRYQSGSFDDSQPDSLVSETGSWSLYTRRVNDVIAAKMRALELSTTADGSRFNRSSDERVTGEIRKSLLERRHELFESLQRQQQHEDGSETGSETSVSTLVSEPVQTGWVRQLVDRFQTPANPN